jgi:hypothetical protein
MKTDLPAMTQPLCFVLGPQGRKRDSATGKEIDFDSLYAGAIEPAIRAAQMDPVRGEGVNDDSVAAQKARFERMLLCDFAIADLTGAGANVFYQLGVRHAARPSSTVTIFAANTPANVALGFDPGMLGAQPYRLGSGSVFDEADLVALRTSLAHRLRQLCGLAPQQIAAGSPVVQLLQGYRSPDIAHLRTDVFRAQVDYSKELRDKLAAARGLQPEAAAVSALAAIEEELGPLDAVETGALIDLLLSYRAVAAFDRLIALARRLPLVLRQTVMVREQLAFAMNRKAATLPPDQREPLRDDAVGLLEGIIAERGPNAETCALLARIFKDRWQEAETDGGSASGEPASGPAAERASTFLRRAITEYTRGFVADWRDSYPGVNVVTLLELEGSPESLAERDRLIPVVRFAVEQKVQANPPDYWDCATQLELAVLGSDRSRAKVYLDNALGKVREAWEPETTARNLRLLRKARVTRGEEAGWVEALIESLEGAAQRRKGGK